MIVAFLSLRVCMKRLSCGWVAFNIKTRMTCIDKHVNGAMHVLFYTTLNRESVFNSFSSFGFLLVPPLMAMNHVSSIVEN